MVGSRRWLHHGSHASLLPDAQHLSRWSVRHRRGRGGSGVSLDRRLHALGLGDGNRRPRSYRGGTGLHGRRWGLEDLLVLDVLRHGPRNRVLVHRLDVSCGHRRRNRLLLLLLLSSCVLQLLLLHNRQRLHGLRRLRVRQLLLGHALHGRLLVAQRRGHTEDVNRGRLNPRNSGETGLRRRLDPWLLLRVVYLLRMQLDLCKLGLRNTLWYTRCWNCRRSSAAKIHLLRTHTLKRLLLYHSRCSHFSTSHTFCIVTQCAYIAANRTPTGALPFRSHFERVLFYRLYCFVYCYSFCNCSSVFFIIELSACPSTFFERFGTRI